MEGFIEGLVIVAGSAPSGHQFGEAGLLGFGEVGVGTKTLQENGAAEGLVAELGGEGVEGLTGGVPLGLFIAGDRPVGGGAVRSWDVEYSDRLHGGDGYSLG